MAERIAVMAPHDVVWISEREQAGAQLHVAPLAVSGLLRERVLGDRTCVFTSATLKLGGDFDAAARSVGLRPDERLADGETVKVMILELVSPSSSVTVRLAWNSVSWVTA